MTTIIDFLPSILVILFLGLLAVASARLYKTFFTEWKILLALQKDSIGKSGFGDACVAYIKARLASDHYSGNSIKNILNPLFKMFFNTHVRMCVDRLLFELENLKFYEDNQDETYSLKREWDSVRWFIVKNPHCKQSKFEIKDDESLIVGEKYILKFEDVSDFFIDSGVSKRIEAKISNLLCDHARSLLKLKDGFSAFNKFMNELSWEKEKYPKSLSLYCMDYHTMDNILQRLSKDILDAFAKEVKNGAEKDTSKELARCERLKRSYIASAFYNHDGKPWLDYGWDSRKESLHTRSCGRMREARKFKKNK